MPNEKITNFKKPAEDCVADGSDPVANKLRRSPRMPFDHDPEKEEAKKTFKDDLTIEEAEEVDREMADVAIKNANAYNFPIKKMGNGYDVTEPREFIGKCLEDTMIRCGVKLFRGIKQDAARFIQKQMDANKIVIENRSKDPFGKPFYKKPEDMWRNGLYIFKDGELVTFISEVMMYEPDNFAIKRDPCYRVITNAKIGAKGRRV